MNRAVDVLEPTESGPNWVTDASVIGTFPRDERAAAAASLALAEAVQCALNETGRSWLQHVVVEVSGRAVILSGSVPSYHLKQLAQVTIMAVPGVELVKNGLEVQGGSQ
jgi:osmotically-inducible protein OsmY